MTDIVLGSRFATWLATVDGIPCVVKSMDVAPADRETSPCWREYLGWRLATKIGLAVPVTQLRHDPHLGRVSLQRFVADARPATVEERGQIAATPRGRRMLFLDFIVRNPDRRAENIVLRGDVVFPIDFNVAFDFTADALRWEEVSAFITRWFQIPGIGQLLPLDASIVPAEARRVAGQLSDAFLERAVDDIPSGFIERPLRGEVLAGLRQRRDALAPTLERWWNETVFPLQQLLKGDTSCTARP